MRNRFVVLWIFLTVVFLFGGCDDDCSTTPHPGQEKIVGQIIGGDGPVVDAWVRVESINEWSDGPNLETSGKPDNEGCFDIAVPPGIYRVSVRAAHSSTYWFSSTGPRLRREDADSLLILDEGDSANVSFVFGGLEMSARIPSGLDDHAVRFRVADSSFARFYESQRVRVDDPPNTRFARFPVIPPGTSHLQLEIESSDYSWESVFWLPPTLDRSQAESFEIAPSEMTSREALIPEPCIIQGLISGPWANFDFSNPYVDILGPDSIRVGHTRVNEFGEFEIPLFAPGKVRIRVSFNYTKHWIGQESIPGGAEFEIVPGTSIVLDPLWIGGFTCNLSGIPVWEDTGANIEVFDQNGICIKRSSTIRNNIIGIPLFSYGVYKFKVVSNYRFCPWRPQWFDRVTSFEEATPIVLSSDVELEEVNIVLETGGSIHGHVYTPGGYPVESRYLIVKSIDGEWEWSHRWRTYEGGTYSVEGLPDGDFILGAVHDNSSNIGITWYPGTNDEASASPITSVDAQEVSGINIWLIP